MSETNIPGSDDAVSRGEVFENTFGIKSADEEGIFADSDRDSATERMAYLFGGADLESMMADKEDPLEQDNVTNLS